MDQYTSVPSWLNTPPSSKISPPVETRPQKLPFHELSWEDFERLCLRIIKLEANVEHCQLYGKKGQKQEGIDIYARQKLSNKYTVYQCKREENFSPAKIEAAVTKFLEGKWVSKTEKLVLCTMESLIPTQYAEKLEEQNERLKVKGIKLIPWDCNHLSILLKNMPEIVYDFLGSTWVSIFCGKEQAKILGQRLGLEGYYDSIKDRYCKWVSKISATFNIPGLGIALPISKAWMKLNVLTKETPNDLIDSKELETIIKQYHEWERLTERNRDISPKDAEHISAFNNRIVVVGGAGSGKSTLLKRLAHKYSNENKIVFWVRLPRLIHQMDRTGDNFEEVLVKNAFAGSGISLDNNMRIAIMPGYILADGLDECGSKRSEMADALVKWGHGHKKSRIIVTTRLIGYDPGLFSDWKHYEILPFQKTDILAYARKILEELFLNEQVRTEKELNQFDKHLASNKTASLAARNPLLLCFLIQLSVNKYEIGNKRVSLYDQIIKCIHSYPPSDRMTKIDVDSTVAFRAYEIFGWLLHNNPSMQLSDLLTQTGTFLAEELGCKSLMARRQAEQALNFWIERRLMEKISIGGNEFAFFIHQALEEFATSRYAASLEEKQLAKWLINVRRKLKWREVILLAAGLEGGKSILQILIDMDDPTDPASIEALLAASALSEIEKPPIDLVKLVANSLLHRLTSNIRSVVLETGYAALKLTQLAPEIIGPAAKSLLQHSLPWTRFVAWNLALHSGEEYVDIDLLEQHYEDLFDMI